MPQLDSQTIGIAVIVVFVLILMYFAFKDKIKFGSTEKKPSEADDIEKKNRDLADEINAI